VDILANGKIDRKEADFLVELHKRVQRVPSAFEQFFYQAIKDHILADGAIGAEETSWLRTMLLKVSDLEKKFLHQLKGEARQVSPEFQAMYEECLK
jgi:hypothetical protein